MNVDSKYKTLLSTIEHLGEDIQGRNGKVRRLIHNTVRFDSTPLISIKKTAWKNALLEWEWFMSGSSNINDLDPKVRHWWNAWVDSDGEIKNSYGRQFREFKGDLSIESKNGKYKSSYKTDQIQKIIEGIKKDPFSRRNILTTWNTHDMMSPDTVITNCHNSLTMFLCDNEDRLNIVTMQRSADMVLGVPHNWIQMWAFLMWIAHRTGKKVGELIWTGVDCHVYEPHFDAVKGIITFPSKRVKEIKTPELVYTPSSEDFKASDFKLEGKYKPLFKHKLELVV